MSRMKRWEEMSWPEIEEFLGENHFAILPAGSVEQHGPHLPLGTDYYIPMGLADRLAGLLEEEARNRMAMLPPLTYTYAPHSNPWPGTMNLDGDTLIRVAADLVAELERQGVARILILNGHMQSEPFIWEGARIGRGETAALRLVNWWDLVPADMPRDLFGKAWVGPNIEHAALIETSVMMALHPDLVREDLLPAELSPRKTPYQSLPPEPGTLPETGSFAPTEAASAEAGRVLVDHVVGELLKILG